MTPYDQKAWTEIERWRERKLSNRARRLIPSQVRDGLSGAGNWAKERFDSIPNAVEFEQAFISAMGGLIDFGSRVAAATIRDERILEAFRAKDHHVEEIADIAKLDLRDVDRVKPNLVIGYTATSTAEGAAAGFAISGGEIVAGGGAVFGAGAGGAPGIGFVLGVMAADAAAVLLAANRAVAHTAAYYGYDIDRPDERVFALGVLSMGTASETGKAAAYVELNKLVQLLARRATWEQLNQNVVTGVAQKVFTRLGYRLTQRKLGQVVPVVGTLIGAGMNARVLLSVVDNADHVYRERFLREKYGLAAHPDLRADDDGYDVVDVAALVEDEDVTETSAVPDGDESEITERMTGDGKDPRDGDDF